MTKRIFLLVEGQTEESFVKNVLAPEFAGRRTYLIPILLTTKRVKDGRNFRGGATSFVKFENDLRLLLQGVEKTALVTMMLDYYGLPGDFPGMQTRPPGNKPLERVRHVEETVGRHVGDRRFLPFLALHEFEAWLFASTEVLPRVMIAPDKAADFAAIRRNVKSPEDINERPDQAPSKRILSLFPAYRKTLYGPSVIRQIGLPRIRKECPHFNEWLSKLEEYAA